MHAILRQKTLLGETYVQLIPEGQTGPVPRRQRAAADSQVEPSVTLDDILVDVRPEDARATSRSGSSRSPWASTAAANRSTPPSRSSNRSSNNAQQAGRRSSPPRRARCAALVQEHRRRLQRARQPRPPARRADRQRRTHLPRGRRSQPGVRGSVRGAAGVRAQLDRRAEGNRQVRRSSRTRSSKNSARPSASSPRCCTAAKPFAPEFDTLPDRARAADEAAKKGLPDLKQVARPDRAGARKPAPGAAQPRPVPAVHGRIRARAAGLLRQPHGRLRSRSGPTDSISAGEGPKQHLLTTMAVLEPREPRALPEPDRHRPRATPTRSRGDLQRARPAACRCSARSSCANSAPVGQRRRRTKRSPKAIIEQIIAFKVANKPETPDAVEAPNGNPSTPSRQRSGRSAVQPAGAVHASTARPASSRTSSTKENRLPRDDHFEYHAERPRPRRATPDATAMVDPLHGRPQAPRRRAGPQRPERRLPRATRSRSCSGPRGPARAC